MTARVPGSKRSARARAAKASVGRANAIVHASPETGAPTASKGRTRREAAARIVKLGRAAQRKWTIGLTLAPSRFRHPVTGVPAGWGVFVACPRCKPRHKAMLRRAGEAEEAFWERAIATCACPLWHRRGRGAGAGGWVTPTYMKGAFVGNYRGTRGAEHAVGEFVMQVDKALAGSVTAPFTVDATAGSLLRYCNGVSNTQHPLCNVYVKEVPGYPVTALGNGWVDVPLAAWRDIYAHEELVLSYGRKYYNHMMGGAAPYTYVSNG